MGAGFWLANVHRVDVAIAMPSIQITASTEDGSNLKDLMEKHPNESPVDCALKHGSFLYPLSQGSPQYISQKITVDDHLNI